MKNEPSEQGLSCIHGQLLWFGVTSTTDPSKHVILCSCCGIVLGIRDHQPTGEELCTTCNHQPSSLDISAADNQTTGEGM